MYTNTNQTENLEPISEDIFKKKLFTVKLKLAIIKNQKINYKWSIKLTHKENEYSIHTLWMLYIAYINRKFFINIKNTLKG